MIFFHVNNIVYQDNQISIMMDNNERKYITRNLRHINIGVFFVKDRVDRGEVEIEYYPTKMM